MNAPRAAFCIVIQVPISQASRNAKAPNASFRTQGEKPRGPPRIRRGIANMLKILIQNHTKSHEKVSTFVGDSTYMNAPPTHRSPLRSNY